MPTAKAGGSQSWGLTGLTVANQKQLPSLYFREGVREKKRKGGRKADRQRERLSWMKYAEGSVLR